MPKELTKIGKIWTKALKSGDYQQGSSYLRKNDKEFCCLGVLCDLYSKAQKKPEMWSGGKYGTISFMGEGHYLPQEVMDWAGLNSERGRIIGKTEETDSFTLANMNDLEGLNFEQISDFIEKNPEKVFK